MLADVVYTNNAPWLKMAATLESINHATLFFPFMQDFSKDPKSTEDSGLQMDYVDCIFHNLPNLSSEIRKVTLKAIINSLLKDLKK